MNVFLTSPWVPPEWIKSHGLQPRGIWSLPAPAPVAPSGVCAYAETVLRHAEINADAAFVFTTHCDQLRRTYDALAPPSAARSFLFNLPATYNSRAALALFKTELERLSRWLKKFGGSLPRLDVVRQFMVNFDHERRRLSDAASWCPPRAYAEALLRFHSDGASALPKRPAAPHDQPASVPLALIGGPFTPQYWSLLDEVESAGGRVALNATEAGERSLGSIPADAGAALEPNPQLESLCRIFLDRIVDVFQRPNDRLYDWLANRMPRRQVRGIILWPFLACDLWRAELRTIEERFRRPVLMLEADETAGGSVRNQTRVQAFLESLTPT